MVRKQVIPLQEMCIKFVSSRLWNFCYGCAPCIELEHSASDQRLQTAKDVLTSVLPPPIIQKIFNHLLNVEYKLHSVSVWDDVQTTDSFVRLTFNKERILYQTEILFLISLILGLEQHSIRIRFTCINEKGILFMLKFGGNIYSLRFYGYDLPSLVPGLLTESSLRMILQSTSNIQEVDLKDVSYSDQFFKVIGEECNQLKVLKGIVVGKRVSTSYNLGLATQSSFKSLFFNTDNERNMCCDSLQYVPLRMHEDADSQIFWNTVTLLINNLPNLTSLGEDLVYNPYLQSVCFGEITKTNIEEMYMDELTCDLVSVLTIYFPKLKKLITDIPQVEVLHQLSKFKFLEDLLIDLGRPNGDEIFNTFVSIQWPVLRNLNLLLGHVDVDITALAQQFPMLTELGIQVRSYTWDCKTHFKCLEKLDLGLLDSDFSWFESFSNTIVHLHVVCLEPVDADARQILLRVPFPCLERLYIEPLKYDFEFYTSVLKTLPKLRICAMLMDHESRTQYVQELSKFLKENNLECAVSGFIMGVDWGHPH